MGLSAETTCFVASDYFGAPSRFEDFVVHEAAHIFHNCKRRTIGLSATRRREWLLDIDYRKGETFAYACEAYSRVLELGNSLAARRVLLSEIEEGRRFASSGQHDSIRSTGHINAIWFSCIAPAPSIGVTDEQETPR